MVKKFSIPDYYGRCDYILSIMQYRQQHPEQFYSDRIIDNCYGAHPDILWTGGRIVQTTGPVIPMEEILEKFPDIELRHVCTNFFITPEIATDYKTNYFIQHYVRKKDKIIVASPYLTSYLKETYPQIKLIYSTTINITDINEVNKLTKDNIYVLNYNYNNDNNYIKKLQNPQNVEMLCGEPCVAHCPNRLKHYQYISKVILGMDAKMDFQCPDNNPNSEQLCDAIMKLPNAITSKRVDELSKMGIQYFKISGRALKLPNWLSIILYYLVLPDYREHVFLTLLNEWW